MIYYKLAVYILLSHCPVALISSAYQAKYIDFIAFFNINSHLFIWKLPHRRSDTHKERILRC